MRFLFWQAFSLPIAFVTASAYFNVDNYIVQFNHFLHTRFPPVLPESGILALVIFLVTFISPNLYLFMSLHSIKEDLLNGKIQRDIRITPHEQYIQISNKNYAIRDVDNRLIGFILISMFPFIIDYSSLALLLLTTVTLAMISTIYAEDSLIIMNPYLRFKYHVFTLQSEDKTLYIIMEKEKEKEFEKPKFSEYVIDWYYDHLVLIGFKDMKGTKTELGYRAS